MGDGVAILRGRAHRPEHVEVNVVRAAVGERQQRTERETGSRRIEWTVAVRGRCWREDSLASRRWHVATRGYRRASEQDA